MLAFIAETSDSFEEGIAALYDDIRPDLTELASGGDPSGDDKIEAPRSSSIWTYLVNDNPFPNFRAALFAGGSAANPAAALGAVILAPLARLFGGRRGGGM